MIKINQSNNVLTIDIDFMHYAIPIVKDLYVRSSSESGGYENHMLVHRSLPWASIAIWINPGALAQVIFESRLAFVSTFKLSNNDARRILFSLIEAGITK